MPQGLYTSDIVLTWTFRKRSEGCGVGYADSVTDYDPSTDGYEGEYKVEVYVSSILVRTEDSLETNTWTYTNAMNISDNGSLASEVIFKLSNYITSYGVTYESDQIEITVLKVS